MLVLPGTLLPILAVSATECVQALTLGGFRTTSRTQAATVLEQRDRRVIVPATMMLPPDDLENILRAAAVSYTEFLELLARAYPDETNATEREETASAAATNETGVRRALRCRETG